MTHAEYTNSIAFLTWELYHKRMSIDDFRDSADVLFYNYYSNNPHGNPPVKLNAE